MPQYEGECECGKVKFVCEGEPMFTQHCHCNKCREIAAPATRSADHVGYGYTAAYLRSHFRITSDVKQLYTETKNNVDHLLCKDCHCLIYGISCDPNKQDGIGVNANNFSSQITTLKSFEPVRHVYYADRSVNIDDELPKYKDMPAMLGGSDEQEEPRRALLY